MERVSLLLGSSSRQGQRAERLSTMNVRNQNETWECLNWTRLPGRLDASASPALLGFQEHDIPVLISAKLLKPLGNPAPNAPKFFAASELEQLAQSNEWLHKATRAIAENWRKKNRRSTSRKGTGSTTAAAMAA